MRHLPFLLFGLAVAVLAAFSILGVHRWLPMTESWWWLPFMLGDAAGQLGRRLWWWLHA
jgi:hypothetical protein